MKPDNDLAAAGLRLSAGCVSHCVSRGGDAEPPIKRLYQGGAHSALLLPTVPAARLMLSVVLSIGGGIVRHFTSYDVGRWQVRLVAKC
jgi:hypothetical protein